MNALPRPTVPWKKLTPAEKQELVGRYLKAHKTAAEIAAALGAPSRQAIAAVSFRMRNPKQARLAPDQPRRKPPGVRYGGKVRVRHTPAPGQPPLVKVITEAAAFDPIPGAEPVSFIEAADRRLCMWAVDGREGPSKEFCGLPRHKHGFCASHHRLAWSPVPPRGVR